MDESKDLKDALTEIRQDIKHLRIDATEIKIWAATNTESLKLHMQRTMLNEQRMEKIENWTLGLLSAILAVIVIKSLFHV